jgi:hypothetical protein
MIKRLVFSIAVLISSLAMSQYSNGLKYRVYLNSGSIITGKLAPTTSTDVIKIQSGENLWVFKSSDVKQLELIPEKRNTESSRPKGNKRKNNYTDGGVKGKGIYVGGGASMLFGNSGSSFDINTGINLQAGMIYNTKWVFGMGAGFDFIQGVYAPFYLETKYLLKTTQVTPYPVVRIGLNKMLNSRNEEHKSFSGSIGLGIQEYRVNGNTLGIEVYYQFLYDKIDNFGSDQFWEWNDTPETNITVIRNYHRYGLRVTYSIM